MRMKMMKRKTMKMKMMKRKTMKMKMMKRKMITKAKRILKERRLKGVKRADATLF